MPTTNLKKIYTSPYRYFNFQQLFFYDIFLRLLPSPGFSLPHFLGLPPASCRGFSVLLFLPRECSWYLTDFLSALDCAVSATSIPGSPILSVLLAQLWFPSMGRLVRVLAHALYKTQTTESINFITTQKNYLDQKISNLPRKV